MYAMIFKMGSFIGGKAKKISEGELDGIGVVEIILILVVLISLVLIFKTRITALVNDIFKTITNNAGAI